MNKEMEERSPPIIIVVEDDETLNRLIRRILERDGLSTEGALCGSDGLDMAADHPGSLLILDYKLPDMTAKELIEKLGERGLSNPFIISTGFGDEEIAVELMKLGALDYIVKEPDFVNKLPQVLHKALDRIEIARKLDHAKRALRESEQRYRKLFEEMRDGFALCRIEQDEGDEPVDFVFLEVNDAFLRMTGLKREAVIEGRVGELFSIIGGDPAWWVDKFGAVALGGEDVRLEHYSETLKRWFYFHIYSPKDGHFATIIEDITQRRESEEMIKRSLQEKEVLLKEIHHRVKNNLQIISSLISLELRRNQALKEIDEFNDILNRVKSISLIHEKLYKSADMGSIDIKEYISDLTNTLTASYNIDPENVVVKNEMESISIGIDMLVPCGLILNELLSNSFKYAFPGDGKGEIRISLHPLKEDELELIFSDNGIGPPEGFDITKLDSLGLKIVWNLVEMQLKGTIETDFSEGTRFVIRFSAPDYKRRHSG